jgi:NAD(P)-dependent dehydrogenase (short-subunit alcohol dehydrogenase family)
MPSPSESTQKLALITGAGSGIGAQAAMQLAGRGYRVILVDRDDHGVADVAATIGPDALARTCDVSSGAAVLALAEELQTSLGTPDLVVNCAGLGRWLRIEDTSPEEALQMIGAPYLAAFNMTHAFMPGMLQRRSGIFIHVNSPACLMAWPAAVGYTAARFALRGLHEALCQDLAGTGVQSCHVIFGRVDSKYFENNPGAADHMPGIASVIRRLSPKECGRVITELAEHPRRQRVHPLMLRLFHWTTLAFPWLTRWLVRITGARREGS